MLALTPSVQSPAGYDRQNLQAAQIAARLAAGADATRRVAMKTALQDSGYRYTITPAEDAGGLTDADLTFGYDPGDSRRYGADTTGTNAAQTALARSILYGGGRCYWPGTYKITAAISVTITGNLVIEGDGNTALNSTVTDDASDQAVLDIQGATSSVVTLRGFSVAHTYTTGAALLGLRVGAAAGGAVLACLTENIAVTGLPYYGMEIRATVQQHSNPRATDNIHAGMTLAGGAIALLNAECDNNGNGTDNTEGYGVVMSGTDARIVGGRFTNNDRYGIDGRYSNNLSVLGAYVYNNGLYQIYAVNEDSSKDASNVKIAFCTVDANSRVGSDHLIWVGAFGGSGTESVAEVDISHNTLKNGLQRAVLVSSGTGTNPPTSVTVANNAIQTVAAESIYIGGTSSIRRASVTDNKISNGGDIFVTTVDHVVITGNTHKWTGSRSRVVYCAATNAVIKDNIFDGTISGVLPIEYTSTRYRIADNIFTSGHYIGSDTYDPPSLVDGEQASTTITVNGAVLGDKASVSFSVALAGVLLSAEVSAADTVKVYFQNESGGTVNLGSGTLVASVRKEA